MNGDVNNLDEVVTGFLSSALPTVMWIFGFIVAIKIIFHFYAMARGEPVSSERNKRNVEQKKTIEPKAPIASLEQGQEDEIVISKGTIQFPKTVKLEK